jgi:hypothetical protein
MPGWLQARRCGLGLTVFDESARVQVPERPRGVAPGMFAFNALEKVGEIFRRQRSESLRPLLDRRNGSGRRTGAVAKDPMTAELLPRNGDDDDADHQHEGNPGCDPNERTSLHESSRVASVPVRRACGARLRISARAMA